MKEVGYGGKNWETYEGEKKVKGEEIGERERGMESIGELVKRRGIQRKGWDNS